MFIRRTVAKNKDGSKREYFQLAESVRINGKPRNRVICTLGRVGDPDTDTKIKDMSLSLMKACEDFKFFDLAEDLKADFSKEYGPFLVFKRLFSELGFETILEKHFSDLNTDFDITSCLFNMILNRLSDPGSKRQMSLWQDNTEGIEKFDLHQYYRTLDYLIEKKENIEINVFHQMRDLFNTELDIVLFDTTTLVYYGEGGDKSDDGTKPEDQELLDYGFSKAHRGDLKQVVVGVLMSKDGIPLGHEVFSGNINDVSCFSEIIGQIKTKYGLAQIVLVGDRGMISKGNIKSLEESKLKYILGYRMRTISKESRKAVLSQVDFRKLTNHELEYKEVSYNGQRLVVCYNAERAELDRAHREDEVKRLREKIKGKSVKQLISNPSYRRFLKIDDDKKSVKINEEKIKEDAIYDGIFVLTTNTKLSCLQVVERYKDLWQIENGFRQLKDELEMGPLYHWKDRRIRAHIMICFMAFCLRVALYKKLKTYFKKEKFSLTELLSDLKSLHVIGLTITNRNVKLRTELKDGANHIFRALGMRVPNRIIEAEIKNVVIRPIN
jgi:transposase